MELHLLEEGKTGQSTDGLTRSLHASGLLCGSMLNAAGVLSYGQDEYEALE